MATITTVQFADDGTTARSAGEVLTVNGGSITFRRDSRDAAGNNYTLGGNSVISATLGGGIIFDGRNVRWLAITGGSGTVAIGATVTQGGVSGYFLGAFSSLTARGSTTIPATGWIKLREVTGGPYSAGALTLAGGAATAAGPDVTGWLEIAADQSANFNIPRLGNFTVRGDWFYLDNTTGSAGQILQVPTNGGGAATECPGVWIETAPASGVYDFFPALKTTAGFTTTNLGTDIRSKFVQNMTTGGQMRIGSDGTNSIGFVPPSGCKTRIPNVFFRQCTAAARQTNTLPHATIATRPDFTTTSAGYIDIEYMYGDWYLLFAQPYYVKLHHVGTFDAVNISECASPLDLSDGFTGMSANLDINSLLLTSNFAGGTITDWGGPRGNAAGSNDHDISVNFCIGQTFTRVRGGIIAFARSSGQPFYINQCSDITLNECRATNAGILVNTSFNININNYDHVDRYTGATNSTTGRYAVAFTNSCVGVKVDGMTFGVQGAVANCHPYLGLVSATACSDIKVRNIGTRSAMLSGGSANNPAYIFGDLGNNVDVVLQRLYLQPTRTGAVLTVNSTKNVLAEDVYGDFADSIVEAALNMFTHGGGGTNGVAGQASVYGTHFGGAFTSDTAGRVWLALNEPTAETAYLVTTNFGAGSGFTSAGGVTLVNSGDYVIVETSRFKKQHTGFENAAPTLTGTNTGNHSFEYQIDTGSGYGAWQTISGANLSAETVDPAVGFKLKFRITCTTPAATNLVSFVRVNTTSTLAAQVANLYPLDTINLTLSGLQPGSDVVVLAAGTETIRDSVDAVSSYTYTYETPESVDIAVYKAGYIPFFVRSYALGSTDASLPVAQVVDRAYLA